MLDKEIKVTQVGDPNNYRIDAFIALEYGDKNKTEIFGFKDRGNYELCAEAIRGEDRYELRDCTRRYATLCADFRCELKKNDERLIFNGKNFDESLKRLKDLVDKI